VLTGTTGTNLPVATLGQLTPVSAAREVTSVAVIQNGLA
jgi:hypothetical protein